MACKDHSCLFLRGDVYIKDWVGDCPDPFCDGKNGSYKNIGNVLSGTIDVSAEVIGTENKFNFKNIDDCSRVAIDQVNLSLILGNINKENLYRALFSSEMQQDFLDGYAQEFKCISDIGVCDFFNFEKSGVDLDSIVVTLRNGSGDVVSTLVLDQDYIVTPSGVEIISDDIDAEGAPVLRLTYDYNNNGWGEFDFGSNFIGPKSLFFRNSYIEEEKNSFDIEIFKIRFSPTSAFEIINEDSFLTIEVAGRIEKDHTRNSWFKIKKQEQNT